MTYQLYNTRQGDFCIDWDTCCQIMRSYYRSQSQLSNAAQKTESQRGLNPLSWGLPDLTYVEVDWDRVRKDAESNACGAGWRLAAYATWDDGGVDRLVSELQGMQKDTRRANAEFGRWQRDASKKSWESMQKSVDSYQKGIDGAKLVRDLSGSILIGAATVATGGAGSAALVGAGLGTALKTTAKYQDTGSLGVAVVEATQNIVLCVLPAARAAKLQGSERVMKVILSAVLDTDKALLEGREVGAALTDGLIAGTVSAAGEGLKKGITYVLDRTAVPIVASVLDKPSAVASEYLTGITKKVGEDRAKKGLQAAARNGGVTHGLTQSRPDTNSWDTALSFGDHDELLLKLAVIDMKKGIGHSWW